MSTGLGRRGSYPIGFTYNKFPSGMQIFAAPTSYADGVTIAGKVGATTIDNAFYGGASTGNLWAQPYVAGINFKVRWAAIETSQGVYDFTKIETIIAQVAAHGGKTIFNIYEGSFNGETRSYVPDYIIADSATYGGSVGHGGEVAFTGGIGYGVVWWNANVLARWQAFYTAFANQYKNDSRVIGVQFQESAASYTAGDITTAGGTAFFLQNYKDRLTYAEGVWAPKVVMPRFNYLPGESSPYTQALSLSSWAIANGHNWGTELAMPSTYSSQYPAVNGTSISTAAYDGAIAIGVTAPSTAIRSAITEYGTTSTWGSIYSADNAANMLRYMAYICTGATTCYYTVTVTSTGSVYNTNGAFAAMGGMITSGYLR